MIDVLGNSGGFVGSVNAGALVTQSYSDGSIHGGGYGIGGFFGYVRGIGAKVTKSFSRGIVFGADQVGGFGGWIKDGGVVEDSYSLSSVTSNYWAAGFIGVISYPNTIGTVSRCYAAGSAVSNHASNYAADLIGYMGNDGVVNDSFADENVSGKDSINTPNSSTITNSLS